MASRLGGKSTYLRSAALTIILGQIGCFVPCSSARFSLIDRVLTRVGAEDHQYKGEAKQNKTKKALFFYL